MEILLVGNNVSNAGVMNEMLKKWGYRAQWSSNGKDAIEKVKRTLFDLVLLDLVLPDMPGTQLISEVRRYWPGIHIITITEESCPEMEEKIKGFGILDYMAKPFQQGRLKKILEHISKARQKT